MPVYARRTPSTTAVGGPRAALLTAAAAFGLEELLCGPACPPDAISDDCRSGDGQKGQRSALLAAARAFGLEEVSLGPRDALLTTALAFGLEELPAGPPLGGVAGDGPDSVGIVPHAGPDMVRAPAAKRTRVGPAEGGPAQGGAPSDLASSVDLHSDREIDAALRDIEALYPSAWEKGASTVLDWSAPWVAMAAPQRPPSYGDSFAVEGYEPCYMEMVNPDPMDGLLDFEAVSHTYFVHGRALSGSVTALAGAWSKPFDPGAAIASMRRSRSQSWPRLQYVVDAAPLPPACEGPAPNLYRGVLLAEAPECHGGEGRTRAAVLPGELGDSPWPLISEELMRRAEATPGPLLRGPSQGVFHSFEREMTEEEILDQWNARRTTSANHGTDAHYQIELWLNHDGHRAAEPEVVLAKQFVGTVLAGLGARVYRTEWRIFSADEDLAGSIDLAVRLPCGALALVDWKRSDKLRKGTRSFGGERMAAPLDHLQDCKCAVYALQLNIYRWLLEAHYGEHVALMILCSVHPDAPFVTAVPDLAPEVHCIMAQRRREHAAAQRAEAGAPPHLRCALTGQLLVDPVRLGDGRAYQRGSARRLLATGDISFAPSPGGDAAASMAEEPLLREEARRLVDAAASTAEGLAAARTAWAAESDLRAARKSWEELMPIDGLAVACARIGGA